MAAGWEAPADPEDDSDDDDPSTAEPVRQLKRAKLPTGERTPDTADASGNKVDLRMFPCQGRDLEENVAESFLYFAHYGP